MDLYNLFVGHKQVDPIQFSTPTPNLPDSIYVNLDRAKDVVVQSQAAQQEYTKDDVRPQTQAQSNPSTWQVQQTSASTNQSNTTNNQQNDQISSSPQVDVKASNLKAYGEDKIKYWADKFAKLGFTPQQQIAVVSSMMQECGLKPKGSVEEKELSGRGNTKKGWAHAGEGGVGFTHWGLKSRLIKEYNNHPLRKGPKLAESEAEYAKTNSRHIADLDDDDQALMVAIFYKNLLNKTQSLNLQDTVAEFYMEKAGRGYGAKVKGSSYDKALYTGKVYQNSHRKLGYTRASKTNGFLKALADAEGVSQKLGVATA